MATTTNDVRLPWRRGVAAFVFILGSLAGGGWIVWSNHATAVRAEHNASHIGRLQSTVVTTQHELAREQRVLADVQRSQAHYICIAVNDVRAEAQSFIVKLAPDNPIPHDAGAPLRASINRANAYKRAVRGQARASFKIARCP